MLRPRERCQNSGMERRVTNFVRGKMQGVSARKMGVVTIDIPKVNFYGISGGVNRPYT